MSSVQPVGASLPYARVEPVELRKPDYTVEREKARQRAESNFGPATEVTLSREAQEALKAKKSATTELGDNR